MANKIIEVNYKEWRQFQPHLVGGPCCNFAFPQGECFAVMIGDKTEKMAAMIWYTFAFRHSPFRKKAIPALKGLNRSGEIAFLNNNIRLLARVSTLPEYRRRGLAKELITKTLPKLKVQYVECITAWEDIRHLLSDCGFSKEGEKPNTGIDYWIWKAK